MKTALKYLVVFGIFAFPFVIFKSLAFPQVFSHVVFAFTLIEILAVLFLWYAAKEGKVVLKKSWVTLALCAYILVLLITAFTGSEFGYSLWTNYSRMTGVVTWLHYSVLFFIVSVVFDQEGDWRMIFRAVMLSGGLLALFSFLGVDGLGLASFAFLKQGGSFLGNTSYNGAYLVLVALFSFIGVFFEQKKIWKVVYGLSFLLIFFNPDLFNFGLFNGAVSFQAILQDPLMLFGLARTSSIVLWIGILGLLALFGISKLKNKKHVVGVALLCLVVALGVYIYGFASILQGQGKIYENYVSHSGTVRPIVWDMAVTGIQERPLFGYGNGNFKYVYQDHLDARVIALEDPPWFDRAHNFVLDELVGTGGIGAFLLCLLFGLIVYVSFQQYLKKEKVWFLFVPFIFFLHFLQLQTFFQTDSTLFLCLLILAFLVSSEKTITIPIRRSFVTAILQWGGVALGVFLFIVCVYVPVRENRVIQLVKDATSRNDRIALLKTRTDNLFIDPVETLRQLSSKFMGDSVRLAQEIQAKGLMSYAQEEYNLYISVYESYMPRYAHYHRYLIEYANLINNAFIFGINNLPKGEELARQAIEISPVYPHPYWVLAVNLQYQGRTEEALLYAKQAYDIDPTNKQSQELYGTLAERARTKALKQSFLFLSEI